MNRIYEELFIVKPDTPEEDIDGLVGQFSSVITTAGGTIDKTEKWGIRRLAYRVDRRHEGFYILLQFTSGPDAVKELERRLRVSDAVMKFLTVRIDEKLKKIEKRRKEREKRAKRKPVPASVAPAPAAPAAPARPAEPARPAPELPGAPAATTESAATEPREE